MMQDLRNAPPGFRPCKSAPCSPAKPTGIPRTRSESFHMTHKVPVGDTPYVKAKNVQLVDKDPERAIPLFWAAINAGDRVDSALKDMAIVMKQQNRAEEAIEAIKSLRSRCSDQAQESLDNILLDLYKRCGRLDDQIALLKHKLCLIQQGMAFNGKRTKTARSQGKKFQVSVEQEATRLLGNLGWALMQQNNHVEAEEAYRRALLIAPDNNKMCNLGICLMKQGRIAEAKETLRRVKPAVADGPRGVDSHLKAFDRAQQMLRDLESEMMSKVVDRVEQSRLFDTFLGSSSIWQPQPCKEPTLLPSVKPTMMTTTQQDDFVDENVDSNRITIPSQRSLKPIVPSGNSLNIDAPSQRNLLKPIVPSGNSLNIDAPSQRSLLKPIVQSGNSLNIDAPPFYSSKLIVDQSEDQFHDPLGRLKRTRSGLSAPSLMRGLEQGEDYTRHATTSISMEQPEHKTRRCSPPIEENGDKRKELLLPDDKDFEEAIMRAVLGSPNYTSKTVETTSNNPEMCQRKIDKRLTAFQDITLSMSPRTSLLTWMG